MLEKQRVVDLLQVAFTLTRPVATFAVPTHIQPDYQATRSSYTTPSLSPSVLRHSRLNWTVALAHLALLLYWRSQALRRSL